MLPPLDDGPHAIEVDATSWSGRHARVDTTVNRCTTTSVVTSRPLSYPTPPLVPRWTVAVGGHVVTAAPGGRRRRVRRGVGPRRRSGRRGRRARPRHRCGALAGDDTGADSCAAPAVATLAAGDGGGTVVIAAQLDGAVRALDAATGAERWRVELGDGADDPQAAVQYAAPIVDGPDVLVGSKHRVAAIDVASGVVMSGRSSSRRDRELFARRGRRRRRRRGRRVPPRGRRPVRLRPAHRRARMGAGRRPADRHQRHAGDRPRCRDRREQPRRGVRRRPRVGRGAVADRARSAGVRMGDATIGTPVVGHGIVVVPTLYDDAVALDAINGVELWRYRSGPSPLRVTHYRGRGRAGFAASPRSPAVSCGWPEPTASSLPSTCGPASRCGERPDRRCWPGWQSPATR